MNGALVGVGFLAFLGGALFLDLGIKGRVSADTPFGEYSGPIGAVLVVLGIVMMGIGAML